VERKQDGDIYMPELDVQSQEGEGTNWRWKSAVPGDCDLLDYPSIRIQIHHFLKNRLMAIGEKNQDFVSGY
jgi:hypothetical protein